MSSNVDYGHDPPVIAITAVDLSSRGIITASKDEPACHLLATFP
jgi:hypothetical protein